MSDLEPFLRDEEVARCQDLVVREYPSLQSATFVTAVDPTRTAFNFVILSPHPKHPTVNLMTGLKGRVKDWDADKAAGLHFVGASSDKALTFFRAVAKEHVAKVESARSII